MNLKSNKGITLISLAMYLILMLAVIGVIAGFKANIDATLDSMGEYTSLVPEFDKMHMYMLDEVNIDNNKVLKRSSDGRYIEFSSGNKYMFSEDKIYKNSVRIFSDIKNCTFEIGKENNNDVLYVNLELGDKDTVSKRLKYVMKSQDVDWSGVVSWDLATNSNIKVGDFVNYSVTVDGVIYDKWRVLHKDMNGHVEIVCYNGPSFTLGSKTDIEKSKNDYSNVISILNQNSAAYKNGQAGYSARHLGSNPYNSKSYETIDASYVQYYNDGVIDSTRKAYLEQKHYETDLNAILSFNSTNKLLCDTGYAWVASRGVEANTLYTHFSVPLLLSDGSSSGIALCAANSSGVYVGDYTSIASNLAPVVSLKSGIKVKANVGNGTENNPWQLVL